MVVMVMVMIVVVMRGRQAAEVVDVDRVGREAGRLQRRVCVRVGVRGDDERRRRRRLRLVMMMAEHGR